MNELHTTWNSPVNNLPEGELEQLSASFNRQMIRRRRFETFWLLNAFSWLVIITGIALWSVATGQTRLTREWALIPLLLVPWAFALHFLRQRLKPAANVGLSVHDSLRAAFSATELERAHLKLVGWLFAIMIPLLAISLQHLHLAHKVSTRELVSMGVFMGGVVLVSGIGLAVRYFGFVMPRHRRLSALLTDLAS